MLTLGCFGRMCEEWTLQGLNKLRNDVGFATRHRDFNSNSAQTQLQIPRISCDLHNVISVDDKTIVTSKKSRFW
jgi:hypothetical protein